MSNPIITRNESQKELIKLFNKLTYRHSRWNVWSDFVMLSAISISNAVDKANAKHREDVYKNIASKYSADEIQVFPEMFAYLVDGMDKCIDQDFLGELYMALELGNKNNGQFFTPYHICSAMAKITNTDVKARIEKEHWISVNDSCCGAGALLIAFANECMRQGVNYQSSVLFVAQDIDLITGCMCYIQLSLLGCPGYVVIGNTLTNPSQSLDKRGLIPVHGENVWYTPLYFHEIWHHRRLFTQMDSLLGSTKFKPESQKTTNRVTEEVVAISIPKLEVEKSGQLKLF